MRVSEIIKLPLSVPFHRECGRVGYCYECYFLVSCWGYWPAVKKEQYDPSKGKCESVFLSDTVPKRKHFIGKCLRCSTRYDCDGCVNFVCNYVVGDEYGN